jgi:DNA-directed RNA polymerase II subunit RPB1
LLKSLEHYILNKIGIKGILNIKKVFTKKSKKKYIDHEGEIKQKDEYIIETDGTNLKKVL